MPRSRSLSVVVIGDINIDWVVSIDDVDAAVGDVKVHGKDTIDERTGGSGKALATALRSAGASTTLITAVGEDPLGTLAVTGLRRLGIRVLAQPTRNAATGKVIIIRGHNRAAVERRAMISHRGANVLLRLDSDALKAIRLADLLLISGYALLETPQSRSSLQAVKIARRRQIPVFLDVVPHEAFRTALSPEYIEALRLVDGVCLELGTARGLLRAPAASVAEVTRRLSERYPVVILRIDNNTETISFGGTSTTSETGYAKAKERTGYLDRVLARQLVSLLGSGSFVPKPRHPAPGDTPSCSRRRNRAMC